MANLIDVLHADFGCVRSRQDTECPKCGSMLMKASENILRCAGFNHQLGVDCSFRRPIIRLRKLC